MTVFTGWRLLWVSSILTILAGCAATESRLPVPYAVQFEAAADVNPNSDGKAAPIQVTVYELKSASAFQSTDYFALQSNARAALGDELLNISRVIVKPGQSDHVVHPGSLGATALGIVAGYRELDASKWRMVVDLPESESTNIYKFWQFSPGEKRIHVHLGKDGMTVSSGD